MIRTSVSEFRVLSRLTQGVRAKRLEEGETVIAVERLVGEHEKQAIEEVESHVDENGLPPRGADRGGEEGTRTGTDERPEGGPGPRSSRLSDATD